MSLTAFFREMKDQWRTAVQTLWPDGPDEASRAEQDRLDARIASRGRRLVALRARIERLLDKLGRQLARLRELSARLLVHKDEAVSAEWERLQRAVARKRARVERMERRYEAECLVMDDLRAFRWPRRGWWWHG